MKLYLIRHLPTTWNEKGKLQGRKDILPKELDYRTLERINEIKNELNNIYIDKYFSSPLKRAIMTAEKYGYDEPIIEDRIIEFDFGEYEGKSKQMMLNNIGTTWYNNVGNLNLGESFSEFSKRINSFISEIKFLHSALLFSHGFVIRYLISKYDRNNVSKVNKVDVKNNYLYRVKVGNPS
jgi:broad specificity phosphatase PhoE